MKLQSGMSTPNALLTLLKSLMADQTYVYSWLDPIDREDVWDQAAQELAMQKSLRIVNASIAMLRGDAHTEFRRLRNSNHTFTDCLHVCFPGPPDYWNWILFNALMSLDLPEDTAAPLPVNYVKQLQQGIACP